jgi:hypothetical protein
MIPPMTPLSNGWTIPLTTEAVGGALRGLREEAGAMISPDSDGE